MKRRGFLVKTLLCTGGVVVGAFSFWKNADLLEVQSETKSVLTLAANPLMYQIEEIVIASGSDFPVLINAGEHLINSQSSTFEITKPGSYVLQYLGHFYGWSCHG